MNENKKMYCERILGMNDEEVLEIKHVCFQTTKW